MQKGLENWNQMCLAQQGLVSKMTDKMADLVVQAEMVKAVYGKGRSLFLPTVEMEETEGMGGMVRRE